MQETSGVFFEMDSSNTNTSHLTSHVEFELAVQTQGEIVLRNLVSLHQVRIDVVLTVKLAEVCGTAIKSQPGHNRERDSFPINRRERTRQTQTYWAHVRIRFGSGV